MGCCIGLNLHPPPLYHTLVGWLLGEVQIEMLKWGALERNPLGELGQTPTALVSLPLHLISPLVSSCHPSPDLSSCVSHEKNNCLVVSYLANIHFILSCFEAGVTARRWDSIQLEQLAVLSRSLDVQHLRRMYATCTPQNGTKRHAALQWSMLTS